MGTEGTNKEQEDADARVSGHGLGNAGGGDAVHVQVGIAERNYNALVGRLPGKLALVDVGEKNQVEERAMGRDGGGEGGLP